MINQQLLDYIRQQLQLSKTKEKISSELLINGWDLQDIEEAFKSINIPDTEIPYQNDDIHSSVTTIKSHSSKKVLLMIIILFVFVGGASAYYLKDNLKNLSLDKKVVQNQVQTANGDLVINESQIVNEHLQKEDGIVNPYLSCYNLINKSEEKDACYFENSTSEKLTDINQCDLIKEDDENDSYYKDYCLNMLAINLKDIKICSFLKNTEHKKECYNYIKNTTGIGCDSIDSEMDKNDCIKLTTVTNINTIEAINKKMECNTQISLSDTNLLMGAGKKSWECFTDRLKKCEPTAIYGFYSMRTHLPKQLISYKIIGKKGALCEVSGPLFNMMSGKISETNCKLDSIIIDKYYKDQKENYEKSYFLVNNVISGYGSQEHTQYCID
jgi:hypothetical protein